MAHVEWSVRVQEKYKKGQCIFGFRATYKRHVVDDHIFNVLSARMAPKN